MKIEDLKLEEISKDIQYLLFRYECYIEDFGGDAWEDENFIKFADKYGFTKINLHEKLIK